MATKVEKKSVSLPPETLAQIEFMRDSVFHAPKSAPLSTLLQWIVSYAYFKVDKSEMK